MFSKLPEEFWILVMIVGVSIAFSIVIIIFTIIWRLIRKKPVFPKAEKLKSPNLLYVGVFLFGGFGFFFNYHGDAILWISIPYFYGRIYCWAYRL